MSLTTGTVKVGRWTYPAVRTTDGTIRRSTKRDGSTPYTELVEDESKFTPDAPAATEERDTYTAEPADASVDFRLARQVLANTWATMIWGTADEVRPVNVNEKRAIELLRALGKLGFIAEEAATKDTGFKAGTMIYMASPNVDEATLPELLAKFDAEVDHALVIPSRKIGGGHPVTNNTHKKPGRSTWTVGSPCPQGHVLEAGDVYVMPSGRKQCKKCRAGYPSNI